MYEFLVLIVFVWGYLLFIVKTKILKLFLLFGLLPLLLYEGCSDQYVEKDFNSKDNYYSSINRETKGHYTILNFKHGESKTVLNAYISGDSVYWPGAIENTKFFKTPLRFVKHIEYDKYISYSPLRFDGTLQLKDDSTISVLDGRIAEDTIYYHHSTQTRKLLSVPISGLNSLSYNNRSYGAAQYFFGGAFIGGLFGYELGSNAGPREENPVLGASAGAVLFGLVGLLGGIIAGSPQVYLFNQGIISKKHNIIHRFGIMAGITSSTSYPGFSDNRNYSKTPLVKYTIGLYYRYNLNSYFSLRPEMVYSLKGGNYKYLNPIKNPNDYNYYEGQTAVLYLHTLEIPLLIDFRSSTSSNTALELFTGPAVNIPFKGELEEYQQGPMDEAYPISSEKANPKPYMSLQFGVGVQWNANFSTELFEDWGLTGSGSARMHEGTKLNLQQYDFLVCAAISL